MNQPQFQTIKAKNLDQGDVIVNVGRVRNFTPVNDEGFISVYVDDLLGDIAHHVFHSTDDVVTT